MLYDGRATPRGRNGLERTHETTVPEAVWCGRSYGAGGCESEGFSFPGTGADGTLLLRNDRVLRELEFNGKVWRTTRFARANGSDDLHVESDEFHLLFLDNRTLTVDDFEVDGYPQAGSDRRGSWIVIHYKRIRGSDYPLDAPTPCVITYRANTGEKWLRKEISVEFSGSATVDRIEVERFSVKQKAERGGRGEPVFVDGRWFFGLEYPASHSRHLMEILPRRTAPISRKWGTIASSIWNSATANPMPAWACCG